MITKRFLSTRLKGPSPKIKEPAEATNRKERRALEVIEAARQRRAKSIRT